jgi:hypothetical protein
VGLRRGGNQPTGIEIFNSRQATQEAMMAYRTAILGLGLLMLSAPAMAQDGQTVNSYTPAQADKAREAARVAGYQPVTVTFAQAGNFFINGTRDGQIYSLTITPDGKVYASMPVAAGT